MDRSGDDAARAETLVDRYGPMVYRLAFARTRSREEAEDVFQEVLLRLVSRRPRFDSEKHARAWLCRVTVNCAHSRWRDLFRRRAVPLEEAAALAAPAPEGAEELEACLERLSPELRTVVHLYYYEGLSGPEIADILRKSESAARMRRLLHPPGGRNTPASSTARSWRCRSPSPTAASSLRPAPPRCGASGWAGWPGNSKLPSVRRR